MTDAEIVADLMAAAPTLARSWELTESHYPPSDPETLPSALYEVESHLLGLVIKDRHRELAPLLAAVERAHVAANASQREHIERCVIGGLVDDCRTMGLDAELFRPHLGPQCRAVWATAARRAPHS
jgi:hypothetical protein